MKLYLYLNENFEFEFHSFSQTIPLLRFPPVLCIIVYTNNLNKKLKKGSHIIKIIFFLPKYSTILKNYCIFLKLYIVLTILSPLNKRDR